MVRYMVSLLHSIIINLHVCFLHFVQVFLCFGNSVASTRFLLQDEFNIQTTQCDNCIIVLPLSFPMNIYDSMRTHSASLSSTHVFHITHCLLCRDLCSASNNLHAYFP